MLYLFISIASHSLLFDVDIFGRSLKFRFVKKWPYVEKSIVSRIFSKNFFLLILSNWVERIKNINIFCQKFHFVNILKTAISLAAIWVVFLWLRCHLTPMLITIPKQSWSHFEALECIFHLGPKKILSSHQFDSQSRK